VRLGLGPERTLVGVLVRLGLLQRLVAILRAARTLFAGTESSDDVVRGQHAAARVRPVERVRGQGHTRVVRDRADGALQQRLPALLHQPPAGDRAARAGELSFDEICAVADQAVELGALWCLLTGGEPLLRPDFSDIYLALKKRGLLVSVFTNACLIRPEHVDLFRRYPPRDVEITMYGAGRESYERVTRAPGSFEAFQRGVRLLEQGGVRARHKAMALRSNVDGLAAMAAFGRAHTKDYFRFDFLLHLRYDRDAARNAEICAERLTPEEITVIEKSDDERARALRRECRRAVVSGRPRARSRLSVRRRPGFTVAGTARCGCARRCATPTTSPTCAVSRWPSPGGVWRRTLGPRARATPPTSTCVARADSPTSASTARRTPTSRTGRSPGHRRLLRHSEGPRARLRRDSRGG